MKKQYMVLKKILLIGLILCYWVWLFYTTQPASENNTYKQDILISDIKISFAHHRGNDRIIIFTDDDFYLLRMNWRNEQKTNNLVERLLSENNVYSITVWKHLPTRFSELIKCKFKVFQIADIRTDSDIYFNITDYNDFQSEERVYGILGGFFLLFCTLVFLNFDLVLKTINSIKRIRNTGNGTKPLKK